MSVLTELQNRGVEDILIACVDGLKGFPEAIETVFPQTRVQSLRDPSERNGKKPLTTGQKLLPNWLSISKEG
ncbi:MAG: transposase [Candidatus Marinimicrobia bacterium]|nr:transposase [Candidatus Neomarinimicrobiota bacterium]